MRQYFDRFYYLQRNLKELRAEHDRAFAVQLSHLLAAATWRLNECEHQLQYHAFGYSPQWFSYPYGARRASGTPPFDRKDYLATLPIEHQGDMGRAEVDMRFGNEYPVTEYLRQDERRAYIYSLYRVNWLGQWVRK